MIVKDESVLDRFRGPGPCEFCGRWSRQREPHHWKPKGHAGGSRLDCDFNLIALGGSWDCACHYKAENGHISRAAVLEKIAIRLSKTPEEVQQKIWDTLARRKA